VLVLDDGFQHRRLARDLDIMLIDATDPWGGGYLLPRGGLREPRSSLRRAGLVVLTRCDVVNAGEVDHLEREVRNSAPGLSVARTVHAPMELVNGSDQKSAESLRGQPVGAFCGIGNPQAFRQTLAGLGADVQTFREFPDHHPYRREDVDELTKWAGELPAGAAVVTTQKDWGKTRVAGLAGQPLWAPRLRLPITPGDDVFDHAVLRAAGLKPES